MVDSIVEFLIEQSLEEITYGSGDLGLYGNKDGDISASGMDTPLGADGVEPSSRGALRAAANTVRACPSCGNRTSLALSRTTRQCDQCKQVFGLSPTQPDQPQRSVGIANQGTGGYVQPRGGSVDTNEKDYRYISLKYKGNQIFELYHGEASSEHEVGSVHGALKFRLAGIGLNHHYMLPKITEWLYSAQDGDTLHIDPLNGRYMAARGTNYKYGGLA